MCSAVSQQSPSSVPAGTDQSRSVIGSSPLMMQEIASSRSLAVTVMVSPSLRSGGAEHARMAESGGSGHDCPGQLPGAGAFPGDKRAKADGGMQITPVSFPGLEIRRWMMQMSQLHVYSFA